MVVLSVDFFLILRYACCTRITKILVD